MSAHALPGTIPGLLRRGSPVVLLAGAPDYRLPGMDALTVGARGLFIERLYPDRAAVKWDGLGGQAFKADVIGLDLTDPTGRCHAAWWAHTLDCGDALGDDFPEFANLLRLAVNPPDTSDWWPESRIARFTEFCKRLAA